jgi:ABC-type branched-subunit amino acid transport system substrate-binding protein
MTAVTSPANWRRHFRTITRPRQVAAKASELMITEANKAKV